MADMDHMELLREYVDHNSESAFAGIVERHINLVYSVAFRFTGNTWLNIPAWRHANGDTLAFADGHVEYWKWRSTTLPTPYSTASTPASLQDLAQLEQTAPVGN